MSVRRAVAVAVLSALALALPAAEAAVQPTGFAFGRIGGNIRPYTVAIANSGVVRVSGAVTVGRKRLSAVQLAALNRVATETNFTMLRASTMCSGSLPDVASTFVRVGARTVRVHGTCVPRYQRMLKALQASVQIQS